VVIVALLLAAASVQGEWFIAEAAAAAVGQNEAAALAWSVEQTTSAGASLRQRIERKATNFHLPVPPYARSEISLSEPGCGGEGQVGRKNAGGDRA
jgi:hypothetical protein